MTTTLRRGLIAAALATTAGLAATITPAAQAATTADPNTLTVAYDASGSSFIAKPKTTVSLGPTTLTATLNLDTNAFTASLPLPPTQASFNIAGFVPTSATVSFIPVGQVTGVLDPNPNPHIIGTARYYLQLTNVKLAGIPAFVGNSCQTAAPVTIPVATPNGQRFNVLSGGTLTGTYTIGSFSNCGLTTALINALVPGPGNTVTFTVANGRLAG